MSDGNVPEEGGKKEDSAKKAAKRPQLGLALGGGAIRGAAHIGVLKALEENELKPDFITGTSIGGLVAGLYAFGKTPEQIRELAASMNWFDISRLTLPTMGLLSNDDMRKVIAKAVGDVRVEDAPIPLALMSADICTGEPVVLKEGDLAFAVMASTCVPGIFNPTPMGERLLVDGGVVENVPVSPLQAMGAEVIVAVDLNGAHTYERPDSVVDVLLNAFDIAIDTTTRIQLEKADVVMHLDLARYSRTDPRNVWELYAEGYRAGILAIKQIRASMMEKVPSPFELLEKRFRLWRES